MYKCLECGHIFDYGEEKIIREDCGEFWGHIVYEDISVCPFCGGEYEETVRCVVCGSEHLEEELCGDVCEECINQKKFQWIYENRKDHTEKVEIVSLICHLFDEEKINQILFEYVMEHYPDIDCSEYIYPNMLELGQIIAKEVEKNENTKV